MQNRLVSALLISAVFLLFFAALFLGRAADDNSLFSWAWAFASVDASRIYLLLIAGFILSFFGLYSRQRSLNRDLRCIETDM